MHNPNFASTNLNYGARKKAASLLLQLIARNVSDNEIQILSFHPGAALTVTARAYGFDKSVDFITVDLPGHFAVWAALEEAKFLHRRFVHATWDVTEVQSGAARALIDEDPDFLKIGAKGL